MLDRLGTFAKFNNTQGFVNKIQQRAFDLQTQISSGQKSQTYTGIYKDASRLVGLQSTNERTTQYMATITQTTTRINTMETQMNSLLDNGISFKTALVTGLNNGNANFSALGQQAEQLLKQVANVLNTKDGDTYVFSGTRTTTAPVDLTKFTSAPAALTADTDYYQGDANTLTAKIDTNYNLDYGVKASDSTFEKYIRGLRIVQSNSTDPVKLREGMQLIDAAIVGLNQAISVIGTQSKTLEAVKNRHADNQTVLATTISSIQDTDVLKATSELANQETLLSAAYSTIGRMSRMSLVQYLN
jgi:flagellar hook-associated protein 3 FlgL